MTRVANPKRNLKKNTIKRETKRRLGSNDNVKWIQNEID